MARKRPNQFRRTVGDFEQELGRRLVKERQRLGMTLEEVADRCDISKMGLCAIENGTRSPKFRTMCLLSRFYSVSLDHWLS